MFESFRSIELKISASSNIRCERYLLITLQRISGENSDYLTRYAASKATTPYGCVPYISVSPAKWANGLHRISPILLYGWLVHNKGTVITFAKFKNMQRMTGFEPDKMMDYFEFSEADRSFYCTQTMMEHLTHENFAIR